MVTCVAEPETQGVSEAMPGRDAGEWIGPVHCRGRCENAEVIHLVAGEVLLRTLLRGKHHRSRRAGLQSWGEVSAETVSRVYGRFVLLWHGKSRRSRSNQSESNAFIDSPYDTSHVCRPAGDDLVHDEEVAVLVILAEN